MRPAHRTFLQGLSEEERSALLAGVDPGADVASSIRSSRGSHSGQSDIEQARQLISRERERRQQLEAQVSSLQAALRNQSQQLDETRSERNALRQHLQRYDERGARLAAQLSSLEQENASLSAKLLTTTNERAQLVSKLEALQMRILELQQGYVSMASVGEEGMERRDLMRRSKLGGLLRDATGAGLLDMVEMQQQTAALERPPQNRTAGSTIAALTRERDALQQRVHELSGRLAEAVSREAAARGAQALRSASWKRSAVQAEAKLATALKRVKELGEEMRKRDAEARQRDRYTSQLERTVMAQHRSLQQQRRMLEAGAAGPGVAAVPGPFGERDASVAAAAASDGAGSGSYRAGPGTTLDPDDLAGLEGAAGYAEPLGGVRVSSPTAAYAPPPGSLRFAWEETDAARGGHQGFSAAGGLIDRGLARPEADEFGAWLQPPLGRSPGVVEGPRRAEGMHGQSQVAGMPVAGARAGAYGEAAGGGAQHDEKMSGTGTGAPYLGNGQAPLGRSTSPPPAVLHQQLTCVEESLAQLYRDLEGFKDYSIQQGQRQQQQQYKHEHGAASAPCSPRGASPLPSPPLSPSTRYEPPCLSPAHPDGDEDGSGSDGEVEDDGRGRRLFAFARGESPLQRPPWSPAGSPRNEARARARDGDYRGERQPMGRPPSHVTSPRDSFCSHEDDQHARNAGPSSFFQSGPDRRVIQHQIGVPDGPFEGPGSSRSISLGQAFRKDVDAVPPRQRPCDTASVTSSAARKPPGLAEAVPRPLPMSARPSRHEGSVSQSGVPAMLSARVVDGPRAQAPMGPLKAAQDDGCCGDDYGHDNGGHGRGAGCGSSSRSDNGSCKDQCGGSRDEQSVKHGPGRTNQAAAGESALKPEGKAAAMGGRDGPAAGSFEGAEEQPRQPLPTHMLGHILRCSHHNNHQQPQGSYSVKRAGAARSAFPSRTAGGVGGGGAPRAHVLRLGSPSGQKGGATNATASASTDAPAPPSGQQSPEHNAAVQQANGGLARAVRARTLTRPGYSDQQHQQQQQRKAVGGRCPSVLLRQPSRSKSPVAFGSSTPTSARSPTSGVSTPTAAGRGLEQRGRVQFGRAEGLETTAVTPVVPLPAYTGTGTEPREQLAIPPSPGALSPISTLLANLTVNTQAVTVSGPASGQQRAAEYGDVCNDSDQQRQQPDLEPVIQAPGSRKGGSEAGQSAATSAGRPNAKRRPHDDTVDGAEDRRKTRGSGCSMGGVAMLARDDGRSGCAGGSSNSGRDTESVAGSCSGSVTTAEPESGTFPADRARVPGRGHPNTRRLGPGYHGSRDCVTETLGDGGVAERGPVGGASGNQPANAGGDTAAPQPRPRGASLPHPTASWANPQPGSACRSKNSTFPRPTLAGWLESSRRSSDSVAAAAATTEPETWSAGCASECSNKGQGLAGAGSTTVSALQRLRDKRLQRAQQLQESAADDGVMVLTLRGSLLGEVMVSPRVVTPRAAHLPFGEGEGEALQEGDGTGEVTVRLDLNGGSLGRPGAAGAAATVHHRRPSAVGEDGHRGTRREVAVLPMASAGPSSYRSSVAGGSPRGSRDGRVSGWEPVPVAPGDIREVVNRLGARNGVGGSEAGYEGRTVSDDGARGFQGTSAPAQHPLMQLLALASEEMQILTNKLEPVVGGGAC